MFSRIIIVFISVMILSVECGTPKKKDNKVKKDKTMEEKMDLFYPKYCAETDENMLKKLEKCEEIQPKSMKDIEQECVKKVLKISHNASYKEIREVECDNDMGIEFDKCEAIKLNETKIMNDSELAKIAIKIMNCGFDCYGIK